MSPVSPAIVAQKSVAQLPRWALLLLCLAYVLPGFVGRQPWKNADIEAFGFMLSLARPLEGTSVSWLQPMLAGQLEPSLSLLHTWLGAAAIRLAPVGWEAGAARLPFMAMLVLTLLATWRGVFALARTREAQPVAFAFGGEASPKDYARTLADAGLLALIACLGLARMSHEITPLLAQLAWVSLVFYGVAVVVAHPGRSLLAFSLGLAGLTLSGAPSLALILGLGSVLLCQLDPAVRQRRVLWGLLLICVLSSALAQVMDVWR